MLKKLVALVKPRVVLTMYDRNTLSACLVLVARSMGIPTLTLVHGVMNRGSGYTPLLADKALCWGELQRDQFLRLGVPPERLIVTGCPWLTRTLSVDARSARKKVGLDLDRPLALLATNPIHLDLKLKMAKTFCEAVSQVPGVLGAVRVHPSEKIREYDEFASTHPGVVFLENHAWSVDEAVAAADLVVGHDSGFCSDALLKGRPVVILDCLGIPLGNGRELIEEAGMPCARSAAQLAERLHQLREDGGDRGALPDRTLRYLSRFLLAGGAEAAANVARAVETHSLRTTPRQSGFATAADRGSAFIVTEGNQ
jgi:hypothetical protein